MEDQYNVVFTGKLQEGTAINDACRKLSEIFKLSAEKSEKLLSSGKSKVVKKGLSIEAAKKYAAEFNKVGMEVHIIKNREINGAPKTGCISPATAGSSGTTKAPRKQSKKTTQHPAPATKHRETPRPDFFIEKNSTFAIIALWLLVPVILLIVCAKVFHIYPRKDIFKWLFLLPPISVLLLLIALFRPNTKKTAAILTLTICFMGWVPSGGPRVIKMINEKFSFNLPFDKYKTTSLHEAAKNGNLKLVKQLVEHGANIDTQTSYGSTPLIMAVQSGKDPVVEYLLLKGANPTIQNKHGYSARSTAVAYNKVNVVRALISHGVDMNTGESKHRLPIEVACSSGYSEMLELLIQNGADVNVRVRQNKTLLHGVNSVTAAQRLLKLGLDPNATDDKGYTPLHEGNVKIEIAKILVKAGADVNARAKNGDTPLHHEFNLDTVQYLIDKGAFINSKNNADETPIQCSRGDQKKLILLKNGADIHTITKSGQTLLYEVSSKELLEYLINNGLDINAVDNRGHTALYYMNRAPRRYKETIPILQKYNAISS